MLNPAVAQVMLPILATWIALAVIERARGLSSIPLLLAHCAVALAPALTFGLLAMRGQLLSTWLGAQFPVGGVLTETNVSQGLVLFSLVLAAIACTHAVGLWFRFRTR